MFVADTESRCWPIAARYPLFRYWTCRVFVAPPLRARCANVASVRASVVRCPTRGHISKTKPDRPTVTMEHYYEVGTADSISASERSPDAPGRGTVPFSGKHDRPVTPV